MTQPGTEQPKESAEQTGMPREEQAEPPMVNPILTGEEDYLDLLENLAHPRSMRWTSVLLAGGYVLAALAVAAGALAMHHWVKR